MVKRGETVTHKTYIAGVAVEIEGTGATETLYLLKDHLGSTDVITDELQGGLLRCLRVGPRRSDRKPRIEIAPLVDER
ncbi:hypothetical protein [Rhodomicrobium lacus]|uniref:hypothetical protein n=1 Tax=Rhodomicrobium lacus TaxID=2498452 RepID=UPI0026E22E7D|nr:hypothetical protein [Rhodomicrobium lacus]WKW51420.1 hypothetical protein QMO75_02720 [Rhodomicrobium lacus]